jgi:glucose-1-phosphate thymidylyltransferase
MLSEEIARKVVGLIPSAGHARRLRNLSCSKEVVPIGYHRDAATGKVTAKPVAQYLVERFKTAGIKNALFIIRAGKWDIPERCGDGSRFDMHFAYLLPRYPYGPPFSVDQAYPYLKERIVALGFPDILFDEDKAFPHILDKLAQDGADVVLGLFPANRPEKSDMVAIDDAHTVQHIEIKPRRCDLKYTWGIAVWKPRFTEYLHNYLGKVVASSRAPRDMHIGDVFISAIGDGLLIKGYTVSEEPYIDIGTPEDLNYARSKIS